MCKNFINVWINSKTYNRMSSFDLFKSLDKDLNRLKYIENYSNLGLVNFHIRLNSYGSKTILFCGKYISLNNEQVYNLSLNKLVNKLKVKHKNLLIIKYKDYQNNYQYYFDKNIYTKSRINAMKIDINNLKIIGIIVFNHKDYEYLYTIK